MAILSVKVLGKTHVCVIPDNKHSSSLLPLKRLGIILKLVQQVFTLKHLHFTTFTIIWITVDSRLPGNYMQVAESGWEKIDSLLKRLIRIFWRVNNEQMFYNNSGFRSALFCLGQNLLDENHWNGFWAYNNGTQIM